MHVLLIHQAFAAVSQAGGTRHHELARHLARKGHRVTIVASPVSYLTGGVADDAGEAADDGGEAGADELSERIQIVRAWTFAGLHAGFVGKVLSFLTFMASSLIVGRRVGDVDVVWGTSPPIFQACSAYAVARLKRVPFVFEVRDLWPAFAVDTGVLRNPLLIRIAERVERFLYDNADRLVINSPGFAPHLASKGVADFRFDLVPNGVETEAFRVDAQETHEARRRIRAELGVEDGFVCLYAGAHGIANDLDTVLQAAELTRDEPRIRYVLLGDGALKPKLMSRAEELGLDNVIFVAPKPKSEIPDYLAAADVCLAILQPIPMFATTYPNKVFDYMAAARPTVLAIDGVIREVVEAADGGTWVAPGDPAAIAEATRRYSRDAELCARQGRNARAYVVENFDRSRQAEELIATLERATSRARPRGLIPMGLKRAFDIAFSCVSMILLAPFVAVLGLLIKLEDRGPVFFSQPRVSKNGRVFNCYKFRTMVENAESRGAGLEIEKNDARITRIGRILRSTSLDEIPQALNVFKGDLAIIGPRPTVMSQVERYDDFQLRRLEMKAGMAGWAWVHGRNTIPWERRIEFDIWYIDHWSLWLDARTFFRALLTLVRRRGVYDVDGTVRGFKGSS